MIATNPSIEVTTALAERHRSGLGALVAAATLADGHEPLGEHKFLRLQHGDDLGRAIVAEDNGAIVGYGHTLTYGTGDGRRTSVEVVVHPDHRGRGVGAALIAAAVGVARDQSSHWIDLWAYNNSDLHISLAKRAGFDAARRLLHLHRHMRALPPASATSVSLRAFSPGEDDETWLALNARVFREHPEQGGWTREDLRARFAQPWFDPNDFLIAERAGIPAGYIWLKIERRENEGQVGEIYVIGVAPESQGTGVGRLLVSAGLSRMRERGADVAAIYVDETNVSALALYESLGFHYHHVDACYSLNLQQSRLSPDSTAA